MDDHAENNGSPAAAETFAAQVLASIWVQMAQRRGTGEGEGY